MPLASVDDVAARLGRPVAADETARVSAFLADVTGLVEDYCGRDMDRRSGQSITLYPEGGSVVLPVPARYQTFLTVSAVEQDGQAVTDYTFTGRGLTRLAGWGESAVALTASWGYETPPASLRAIACSEVIRWLALSPGVESERVGEVEVTFAGASSAQTLSAATRTTLRPYRRRGAGSITLKREGPALDLRGPDVL